MEAEPGVEKRGTKVELAVAYCLVTPWQPVFKGRLAFSFKDKSKDT